MTDESFVIIGGGQAGACAALSMRQAGFAGHIVLIGEEPHLPYERPPLSKEMLTGAQIPAPASVLAPERYEEQNIAVIQGAHIVAIDAVRRQVVFLDGRIQPYDKLLIATGGTPRRLRVPGAERVSYLRTLDEAMALRQALRAKKSLICIGAGVIGLEIAASARLLGLDVSVLEAGPGPLGRCVVPEIGRFVADMHSSAGVRLKYGVKIIAIEPAEDGGSRVVCADGAVFTADCVVAGIGLERNTELAVGAGVAVDNGIVVDETGRSETAGIYAAGDVAAFWHPRYGRRLRLESWRHAQNHGIAVGRAMCGNDGVYDEVPWFWTDQFGVNLQIVGLLEDVAHTIIEGDVADRQFIAVHLDADSRVVGASAANRPRELRALMKAVRGRDVYDPTLLSGGSRPAAKMQSASRLRTVAPQTKVFL